MPSLLWVLSTRSASEVLVIGIGCGNILWLLPLKRFVTKPSLMKQISARNVGVANYFTHACD